MKIIIFKIYNYWPGFYLDDIQTLLLPRVKSFSNKFKKMSPRLEVFNLILSTAQKFSKLSIRIRHDPWYSVSLTIISKVSENLVFFFILNYFLAQNNQTLL